MQSWQVTPDIPILAHVVEDCINALTTYSKMLNVAISMKTRNYNRDLYHLPSRNLDY